MTDNHKGPLRPEDGLQAALADPFSVPNLLRISPFQPTNPATRSGTSRALRAPAPTSPESSVSPAEFEAWKYGHPTPAPPARCGSAEGVHH
ncbi:hypothetical protein EDB85DRAFT_2164551 [Lactarius pseudohatsudake]|nr:hypothetical protein EDB85DRAFT_2164551 [Lactarius pseudohatsudake]